MYRCDRFTQLHARGRRASSGATTRFRYPPPSTCRQIRGEKKNHRTKADVTVFDQNIEDSIENLFKMTLEL